MAQQELSAKEILGLAKPIAGRRATDFDPMESIPTLAVGEDGLTVGQTLAGYFVQTERLVSAKFTYSQEKEDGKGVQYRHVLRNEQGAKYAIWNAGELKMIFSKIPVGAYIELTYRGKSKNANGQDQHNFTSKVDLTCVPTAGLN